MSRRNGFDRSSSSSSGDDLEGAHPLPLAMPSKPTIAKKQSQGPSQARNSKSKFAASSSSSKASNDEDRINPFPNTSKLNFSRPPSKPTSRRCSEDGAAGSPDPSPNKGSRVGCTVHDQRELADGEGDTINLDDAGAPSPSPAFQHFLSPSVSMMPSSRSAATSKACSPAPSASLTVPRKLKRAATASQLNLGTSTGGAHNRPILLSRNLIEAASRPMSALEQLVFVGNSELTVTGKQSGKLSIKGKPHHVTTLSVRNTNILHSMPGGAASPPPPNQAVSADSFSDKASMSIGGRLSSIANNTFRIGNNSIGAIPNAAKRAIGNVFNNNSEESSIPFEDSNNPLTTTSLAFFDESQSSIAAPGTASSSAPQLSSATAVPSSSLPRHHIVMGFGDEYEGEVVKIGQDWIPHGQGVLQSVMGMHCYVGQFKMKKREGRGKLATPRFVLWCEWKDNRPDIAHSVRIDNCLTGERFRGNFKMVTDAAELNQLTSNKKPSEVSKFSQWLQCSNVEYAKFGELVSQNGTRYFGEWYKGQQTGFGVQIFPNGDRYVGLFLNGLYHGNGTYFTYRRPRVCDDCRSRDAAYESSEAALDQAQASSLLLRAHMIGTSTLEGNSEEKPQRKPSEIYEILTKGAGRFQNLDGDPHGDSESKFNFPMSSLGAQGGNGGFLNCGLTERVSVMGDDGTAYDGLWEKGKFKGEGTHVILPDKTRITATWHSVGKAEDGQIFGPSADEKGRKWVEHFHWEPLLCAASQDRRDKDFEVMAPIRQKLRYCNDKIAFTHVLVNEILRSNRTIINAIKMFRRCFYASFGTCGALSHIGAGGGAGGGMQPAMLGGITSQESNRKTQLGWCGAHKTDLGGCIHIGKGRRMTTFDVQSALTDIFSFVGSVQRFVEEMLSDDVEMGEAYDDKYFQAKQRVAHLSAEGDFPSPLTTNSISDPNAVAERDPLAGIVLRSTNDRVYEDALDAYIEYEGVALLHREVFDAIMREVHDLLRNLYTQCYAPENRAVHVALQRLAGITLDDLGVNFGRHSAEEQLFDPYAEATRAIEGLTKYKSLSAKLRCLRQWSQAIDVSTRLAQVKMHDDQLVHLKAERASRRRYEDGKDSTSSIPASPTKVKAIESGSADDLLPIHQYVLMHANVPDLLVEAKILLDVTNDPHLVDITSQDSFCITTLQACVSSIPQLDMAILDESAVVTPSAMFAHRCVEALLPAATLPSMDLVEFGYLRDCLAVMLGVLPEFPQLTLPLHLEAPAGYPLDTFSYVLSWVPQLFSKLFVALDDSSIAIEWQRRQRENKREEGKQKDSATVSGSQRNLKKLPPPPPAILLPLTALAESGEGNSQSLLDAILYPLSQMTATPPADPKDTDHEGHPLEAAVRSAALREMLYRQRLTGIDDTVEHTDTFLQLVNDKKGWPAPTVQGTITKKPSNLPIIGDSDTKAFAATPTELGGSAAFGSPMGVEVDADFASVDGTEAAAAIAATAPKAHHWSELYVEDMDLLAYQIKNALAGGKHFEGVLNRPDFLLVWYLSLTSSEREIFRFAKRLFISVRCLAALNVQLCIRKALYDGKDSATEVLAPQMVAEMETAAHATDEWLPLITLFPVKATRIEELKEVLSVGARLATLFVNSKPVPRKVASLGSFEAEAEGSEEVTADCASSSNWSLDFEADNEVESEHQVPTAADSLSTAPFSQQFCLRLPVVHESSVYVDAARALLRCDQRERT